MQYSRPNLWKSPYASLQQINALAPSIYNLVAIPQSDALLIATQLEKINLTVSGTMAVTIGALWSGTLDLAAEIDTFAGTGINGRTSGFAPYEESYYYLNTQAAPAGLPLDAVPWNPRPDPASRVFCGGFTSQSFAYFDAEGQDANQRYSRLDMVVTCTAGVWYLAYRFLFAQNPPPVTSSPPFYLCNPNDPGAYDLRASGTWSFMGHELQWQARSPLSGGPNTWGPATGCGIVASPSFY